MPIGYHHQRLRSKPAQVDPPREPHKQGEADEGTQSYGEVKLKSEWDNLGAACRAFVLGVGTDASSVVLAHPVAASGQTAVVGLLACAISPSWRRELDFASLHSERPHHPRDACTIVLHDTALCLVLHVGVECDLAVERRTAETGVAEVLHDECRVQGTDSLDCSDQGQSCGKPRCALVWRALRVPRCVFRVPLSSGCVQEVVYSPWPLNHGVGPIM